MALAEYPMPSVSGSNPDPLFFKQMPEIFQVGFTQYDDGGRDFKLQNGGSGIKKWLLKYDGLTEAQAALLDAHKDTAKLDENGVSAFAFNFRDKISTTLYSNVRYTRYVVDHTKRWSQSREVELTKFP
jgi:hypothetical protein